ncbi:hypothetical protein ACHAW6_012339 [Cyclotella cf. meneghiniana]
MVNASTPSVKSGCLIIEPESRTAAPSANKSARFSVTSTLKFMHYPSSMETHARWYNKDDRIRFLEARARDVMKCSRLVIAKMEQNGRLSAEDRVQFIGLEQSLKQNIHCIIILRKNHVRRILLEQQRQHRFNECSEEQLAQISEASSKLSRALARRLAVSSMEMLSEEDVLAK